MKNCEGVVRIYKSKLPFDNYKHLKWVSTHFVFNCFNSILFSTIKSFHQHLSIENGLRETCKSSIRIATKGREAVPRLVAHTKTENHYGDANDRNGFSFPFFSPFQKKSLKNLDRQVDTNSSFCAL